MAYSVGLFQKLNDAVNEKIIDPIKSFRNKKKIISLTKQVDQELIQQRQGRLIDSKTIQALNDSFQSIVSTIQTPSLTSDISRLKEKITKLNGDKLTMVTAIANGTMVLGSLILFPYMLAQPSTWGIVTKFLAMRVIYSLADKGLAELLGLEILRHGTNPISVIAINLIGANPQHGGSSTGSCCVSKPYMKNSREFFHVFKDSEISKYDFVGINIRRAFLNLLPKLHAGISSASTCGQLCHRLIFWPAAFFGGIVGFMTPTLIFKFSLKEVHDPQNHFENDPDYGGSAYRTIYCIPPRRLGITGSLFAGINGDMFSRMRSNLPKIAMGAVQLLIAGYLLRSYYGSLL